MFTTGVLRPFTGRRRQRWWLGGAAAVEAGSGWGAYDDGGSRRGESIIFVLKHTRSPRLPSPPRPHSHRHRRPRARRAHTPLRRGRRFFSRTIRIRFAIHDIRLLVGASRYGKSTDVSVETSRYFKRFIVCFSYSRDVIHGDDPRKRRVECLFREKKYLS